MILQDITTADLLSIEKRLLNIENLLLNLQSETYLSIAQAAKKLSLSPDHVRRLCVTGKIKSEKTITNRWRIQEKSLHEFRGGAK